MRKKPKKRTDSFVAIWHRVLEKPWFDRAAFLSLFILAIALRLYGLTSEVLWFDEIAAVTKAGLPTISEVWDKVLATETTPPLYYILLHFWLRVSSSTEWIRLSSTLMSLACFAATGLLAHRIGGRVLALLTCFLMTISQYQIYYAQETRTYAALMCLCVVSSMLLCKCFDEPFRRSNWFLYVVSATVGMHFHYCFFFTLLGHAGYVIWAVTSNREIRKQTWKALLVVSPILLLVAYLSAGILVIQRGQGLTEWIPRMSWDNFNGVLRSFSCGIAATLSKHLINACILIAVSMWVWFFSSRRFSLKWRGRIFWFAVVPMALMVAISFRIPVVFFGTRYLSICQPFFVIALAGGFLAFPKRWNVILLVSLSFVWLLAVQNSVNTIQKRRYDLAAKIIVDQQHEGDHVIVIPNYSYECLYYFRPEIAPALGVPHSDLSDRFEHIFGSRHRVWVVSITPSETTEERMMQLFAKCNLTVEIPRSPYLRVSRYISK